MKTKKEKGAKNKADRQAQDKPVSTPPAETKLPMEHWLRTHRFPVLGSLILFWMLIRLVMFNTVANGPLFEMYRWPASDNYFYDEWARELAAGDWLNRQSIHPYHGWHQEFADYYFKQHPEKLREIQSGNQSSDSTFIPGKVLWNEWYGGNTYHQEPLYAYVLAMLYALTGQGAYWMLLLQIFLGTVSGVLLWRIACRHFGDTVGLITGLLYLFCGIVLFQEMLLLRTSWIVFFVLATIYIFDNALIKGTKTAFFKSGLVIGLAFLLQSVFVLFLVGVLAIYWRQELKKATLFVQNAGMMLAGFLLIYAPLMLRNVTVGAPMFSISSVGAVTFVAANVQGTKTVETWMPDATKCAEIMGKTNGKFVAAAVETLGTHPRIGSYIALQWSKFRQVFNGLEWPNNENYYFYKQLVPALDIAFLNFYWIGWLGVAGLLFSMYYRRKHGVLYVAIGVQLLVLIGFYVLGRFRCPLAVLLLPFAAYALVECCRVSSQKWQHTMLKVTVAALCFFVLTYSSYRPGSTHLDATDYKVFYDLNYFDRIKTSAESGQYAAAIAAHIEFLQCQPNIVKNIKPYQLPSNPMDIDILYLFAEHFQIQSYLYEDSGDKQLAANWMARHTVLKNMADNARNRLKK